MAAFSLVIASISQAQDSAAKGHRRLGKGAGLAQKPGLISPENRAQHFLQKWDKDGDGKLDQSELTTAFTEKLEKIKERRAEHQSKASTTPKPTP